MATALDLITRAFRKLGIVARDTPLPAEDAAHGLDALNAMLFEWELRGLGHEHTALVLGDDVEISTVTRQEPFHEGIMLCLAAKLAPDYGIPLTFDADDAFRQIQATLMTPPTVIFSGALLRMPSQPGSSYYPDDDA